jgi:hypothetical protein
MVSEIRIYVEGGGDDKSTKIELRHGFDTFFRELVQEARNKRVRWKIITCGSRTHTFRNFRTALQSHPDAFNVLLVDSEANVDRERSPWTLLQQRDGWSGRFDDSQCQLMVQTMEHWLIADKEALKRFYGAGFRERALPKTADIEQIDKQTLERGLIKATVDTAKGKYHKIRHAPQILALINVSQVRTTCYYCNRLFTTIIDELKGK